MNVCSIRNQNEAAGIIGSLVEVTGRFVSFPTIKTWYYMDINLKCGGLSKELGGDR